MAKRLLYGVVLYGLVSISAHASPIVGSQKDDSLTAATISLAPLGVLAAEAKLAYQQVQHLTRSDFGTAVQPPSSVPEPGTLTLLGLALAGLAGSIRRKR
jgi:hypothetical protein